MQRLEVLDGSRGRPTLRRQFWTPLIILTALVASVLALVCVNVGNLMLARAATRQREMSVRLALGAGRLRLVRQLLVEALVLAAAGGVLGLLFSGWAVSLLARLADAPAEVEIATDWRVLVFAMLVTAVTGVLSYVTAARRREIGVRMALGATPGAILRLVLGQSLPVIAGGSLGGVAMASAAARYLQPLLFELEPFDPVTLVGAAATVVVATTTAAIVPARRAARTNPAVTVQ